jgi:hypothetical protein
VEKVVVTDGVQRMCRGCASEATQTHGMNEINNEKEKESEQINAITHLKSSCKYTNKRMIKQNFVNWLKAALSLCYQSAGLDV